MAFFEKPVIRRKFIPRVGSTCGSRAAVGLYVIILTDVVILHMYKIQNKWLRPQADVDLS